MWDSSTVVRPIREETDPISTLPSAIGPSAFLSSSKR